MNIVDISTELFECHIFEDLFPHCRLINENFKCIDTIIVKHKHTRGRLRDDCVQIIIVNKLCFYNNKPLLLFYQFCGCLDLNKILYLMKNI